jgi:hypothetical protein
LAVAQKYSHQTYVPYVWGGSAIGDKETCDACRSCIEGKRHLAVERRQKACQACRQCGVDCSHFVNRMFKDAGLPFPYLTTSKMKRLSPAKLRSSHLVNIGRDLSKARPGDLLVTAHHVVMLLALRGGTVGDFIHVSRSIKHGRIGGVELVQNKDLMRYRGRILRILRHVSLDEKDAKPEHHKKRRPLISPRPVETSHHLVAKAE